MNTDLFFIAAEGPNGYFFPSDFKEFIWGSISFLIVASLLVWKVGPIISKMLNDAQASAVAEANTSDTAVREAEAEMASLKTELGDADAEGRRIVAEAHDTANQLRVDENAKTQKMVNDMWERAQNDVVSMRGQAGSDIQGEVSAQAITAAEAVVLESLDSQTHVGLIDDYINQVGAS